MGRRKTDIWGDFSEEFDAPPHKVKRVTCKFCSKDIAANATNLKEHQLICKHMPQRSIGYVSGGTSASAQSSAVECGSVASSSSSSFVLATRTDRVTVKEKQDLDRLLASAIAQTCTSFSIFEHAAWQLFFTSLRPSYKLPSPTTISTKLLGEEYESVMTLTRDHLRSNIAGVLGIDGATNVISKGKNGLIFQEYVSPKTNAFCFTLNFFHVKNRSLKRRRSHTATIFRRASAGETPQTNGRRSRGPNCRR